MPTQGTQSVIYGGEGDDLFVTDRDQLAPGQIVNVSLYGGAGNDRIESLRSAVNMRAYGGDGDDKIILGGAVNERAIGGDGNDIIYYSEIDVDFNTPGPVRIYGDSTFGQL